MRYLTVTSVIFLCLTAALTVAQEIPLPEHPNPIFERSQWINLNGRWQFQFDGQDRGVREKWSEGITTNQEILVPFPWGSPNSEIDDQADIGWYQRSVAIPSTWATKKIFLVIGASDWETTVWLDGELLGQHRGGYVPFEIDLSSVATAGSTHRLVIRVDDARRNFTLYGKQGYGNARGIWQTLYLEARPEIHLRNVHFTPDIDQEKVELAVYLNQPSSKEEVLQLSISTPKGEKKEIWKLSPGKSKYQLSTAVAQPRLWTLDDPYLYEVVLTLAGDTVQSYFGMRKISVTNLPGTSHPYVALNNQPVYLQMALDQSYHPEGYYTFPSDQFLQDEIMRSKSIGLNGIRTHVKVEVPRKLYWADRMGLLVMEDLPNSWGEPDAAMRDESTYTLKRMIDRDYNHPSIFSWCIFNETWGLKTKTPSGEDQEEQVYLPETQNWVVSMYYLAKSLDPSRLIEDNSICCGFGHTRTDLNSWHVYLPGYEWDDYLQDLTENTFPGSNFNFESGFSQEDQPNFNSECGNVWGYDGSTGDVDWSYDYHRMINTFRLYPKVGGWLYTEHHDVVNEWNGYWRYDRGEKYPGFDEIYPGMTLHDLHSPIYLSTGNSITRAVQAGSTVEVPIFLSDMAGADLGDSLQLAYTLELIDQIGKLHQYPTQTTSLPYQPWMQHDLNSLQIKLPDQTGLAVLKLALSTDDEVLHRNFCHFVLDGGSHQNDYSMSTVSPTDLSNQSWSEKQWIAMDGRKINGAGSGFFEYDMPAPAYQDQKVEEAFFIIEVGAKQLLVKDQENYNQDQDFMKGARVSPSGNPNAYPMTDEDLFPSNLVITINGTKMKETLLPDDPADHRGVLSWFNQQENRQLDEAGSYGYLVKVNIPRELQRQILERGGARIRLAADGGGLAVYGKNAGRYPVNPSLVVRFAK